MQDCVFCKIAAGCETKNPPGVVYEDDACVVLRAREPLAPQHLIAFPKEHADDVTKMPPNEVGELIAMLVKMGKKWNEGFRLVVNTGPDAGQSVRHAHVHLIGGAKLGGIA